MSYIYLPLGAAFLALSLYAWQTRSLFAAGADGDVMIKMRALLLILASVFGILSGILGLISVSKEKVSLQCMAIGFLLLLMEITIFIINLLLSTFSLATVLGTLASLILSMLYLTGV